MLGSRGMAEVERCRGVDGDVAGAPWIPFCATRVPPLACTNPVLTIAGLIVPKPLVVPALLKLGALKVPPCIVSEAPALLVTAPPAVRLPPKVKLPLLLNGGATVKVVPLVLVSGLLALIVQAVDRGGVVPALRSRWWCCRSSHRRSAAGGPGGVHLLASVVQLPVASFQDRATVCPWDDRERDVPGGVVVDRL